MRKIKSLQSALRFLEKLRSCKTKETFCAMILDYYESYSLIGGDIPKGRILYRVRKLDHDDKCPQFEAEISYPPADKKYISQGRCNAENKEVLYLAAHQDIAISEAQLEEGDLFILSKWKVNTGFMCTRWGYSVNELINMIGEREREAAIIYYSDFGASFEYIHKHFNKWFTDPSDKYYQYTGMITETIIDKEFHLEERLLHDRMGLAYKSVQFIGQTADNLVLSKKAADDKVVTPFAVAYCRMNKNSFYTDDDTSEILNGELVWKRSDTAGKVGRYL